MDSEEGKDREREGEKRNGQEKKKEEKRNLRQSTLDKTFENKRKVNFEIDKRTEIEQLKKELNSEIKGLRNERLELEKLKIEIKQREMEAEERIVKIENRMEVIEKWIEAEISRGLPTESEEGSYYARGLEGSRSTRREAWSETEDGRSVEGASIRSGRSMYSAWSLGDGEIGRIRKMIREKDRIERERNIVIKGVRAENENLRDWVVEMLADRLGVRVEVEAAWRGGSVIVARLGSVGEKRQIMGSKSKLAGTKIFIENDLSYEDRKRQEEMAKWVRSRREEGWSIKLGIGKIFAEGKWIRWEDKGRISEIEGKKNKETESVGTNNKTNKRKEGENEGGGQEFSEEVLQQFFG